MRRLNFLGFNMALAVVLSSSSVLAADGKDAKGDDLPADSNWFTRMFAPTEKPAAKKKVSGANKGSAKKPDQSAKPDPEKEQEQKLLQREQAAYLRRSAVCNQLKEVALRNNDFALSQKAEQLEAQAFAVYNKRIARLKASNAVYQPDQAALDIPSSPGTPRLTASTSNSSRASKTTAEGIETKEEKP
jgi:hypothetical protein